MADVKVEVKSNSVLFTEWEASQYDGEVFFNIETNKVVQVLHDEYAYMIEIGCKDNLDIVDSDNVKRVFLRVDKLKIIVEKFDE